jgi:DNA-binding response OmpR family regulator
MSLQRSDRLLTRAMLLKEVWKYRFVPRTNLVDVHMGRLRRKVDEPHEIPMIHNEQFIGFLRALAVDAARSDDERVEKAGKGMS